MLPRLARPAEPTVAYRQPPLEAMPVDYPMPAGVDFVPARCIGARSSRRDKHRKATAMPRPAVPMGTVKCALAHTRDRSPKASDGQQCRTATICDTIGRALSASARPRWTCPGPAATLWVIHGVKNGRHPAGEAVGSVPRATFDALRRPTDTTVASPTPHGLRASTVAHLPDRTPSGWKRSRR